MAQLDKMGVSHSHFEASCGGVLQNLRPTGSLQACQKTHVPGTT